MNSFCKNIIDAHAIASNNSAPIVADQMYAASFIASFSVADGAGACKIQASNYPVPSGNFALITIPDASWVDVPLATATIASGATTLIPMPTQFSYRWLRVVWTRTGGTGTITVAMNAQGF